jgi:hypothetical protein
MTRSDPCRRHFSRCHFAIRCAAGLAFALAVVWAGSAAAEPVAAFKQSRVKLSASPVLFEPRAEQAPLLKWSETRRMLDGIAAQGPRYAAIGAELNRKGLIDSVVYPFSGFDAVSPFALFRNGQTMPRRVLMIDDSALGGPKQIEELFYHKREKGWYFRYLIRRDYSGAHFVTSKRGLGAKLLWELERLGAEKIEIEYLDRNGNALSRAQVSALDKPTRRERHGAARIRFQLGGQIREIVYVQHRIGKGKLPPLVEQFIAPGFDALLDKASGGAAIKHHKLMARLFAKLDRHHGLFASDDAQWREAVNLGLVSLGKARSPSQRFGYASVDPKREAKVPKNGVFRPRDDGLSDPARLAIGLKWLAQPFADAADGKHRARQRQRAIDDILGLLNGETLDIVARRARELGVPWPAGVPRTEGDVVSWMVERLDVERSGKINKAIFNRGLQNFGFGGKSRGSRRIARRVFGILLDKATRGRTLPPELFVGPYFDGLTESSFRKPAPSLPLSEVLRWHDRIDRAEQSATTARAKMRVGALREALQSPLGMAVDEALKKSWLFRSRLAKWHGQPEPKRPDFDPVMENTSLSELREIGRPLARQLAKNYAAWREMRAARRRGEQPPAQSKQARRRNKRRSTKR